jgi:hypothetical protein
VQPFSYCIKLGWLPHCKVGSSHIGDLVGNSDYISGAGSHISAFFLYLNVLWDFLQRKRLLGKSKSGIFWRFSKDVSEELKSASEASEEFSCVLLM